MRVWIKHEGDDGPALEYEATEVTVSTPVKVEVEYSQIVLREIPRDQQ